VELAGVQLVVAVDVVLREEDVRLLLLDVDLRVGFGRIVAL
jgi:hypothetical protein